MEPHDAASVKYYEQHQGQIEDALSGVMDSVISAKPELPIAFIGKELLELEHIDCSMLTIDPSKPDDRTMTIKGMIAPIFEQVRKKSQSRLKGMVSPPERSCPSEMRHERERGSRSGSDTPGSVSDEGE